MAAHTTKTLLRGPLPFGNKSAHNSRREISLCNDRRKHLTVNAHRVEINTLDGQHHVLEVDGTQTILEVALEQGLELSHDCKMGVCMTCPARLVSGEVDQTAGMLSEDVIEKGYALLCVAQPQSDCTVATIEEEELLKEVMHS